VLTLAAVLHELLSRCRPLCFTHKIKPALTGDNNAALTKSSTLLQELLEPLEAAGIVVPALTPSAVDIHGVGMTNKTSIAD
jgi:hypothetical protein